MSDDLNLEIILKAINETGSPFSELSESIKSLQSSVETLSKTMSENFQSMTKTADTLSTDMSKDMSNASKSIAEFEKTAETDLAGASQSMNTLRSNMNKGVDQIGGLIAIQMLGQSMEELGKKGEKLFSFAIDQGSDFQQTMKNVQTVLAVNDTGQGTWNEKLKDSVGLTDQLQQKALDLGSRGAQSANEVGKAVDTMLRSGVDGKAILGGAIESAQNVAIVTGDKLDESANLVTEIYHQFRSQFSENGKSMQDNMKDTGNVLTGTLLSARINSQDFLDTLKYVGPVASQLGSSFTDAATATALLAQNGIKGSQAGNNLKRAFTNLLEPTKSGADAMKHLGLIQNGHNKLIDESTGKMKTLTEIQAILHKSMEGLTEVQKAKNIHDIFGQYAMAGSLVLANENSEAFTTLRDKIAGVSAADAASSMLDTFSGEMAKLHAHVETTAKEFGMAFIPVLEKLLPIGQRVLDWFQNLSPHTKELMMGALGVGSALAIAGGALATLAISLKFAGEGFQALGAIMEVMSLSNPFGWIVLAVAAIIGLSIVIYKNWDEIKAFFEKTWNEITRIASDVWNALTAFFKKWGLDILAILLGPIGIIAKIIFDNWASIKKFTADTWNAITSGISNIWNTFTKFISDAVQKTMAAIVSSFSWLYDHNYYFKDLVDFIVKLWAALKKATTEAWDAITDFLTKLWDGISKTVTEVWNAIKSFIETLWEDLVKIAKDVWQPVAQFFTTLFDGIDKGITKVWNGIKTFLSGLWNGIISDAKDIFNSLGSFFSDLGSQAFQWGANLVNMIADGIKNAAHKVADAAHSVVSSVAGFLGFHSPAKEGPGKDADTWMPNLFKMLTDQIHQSIPNMQAALQVAFNPSMTGITNMAAVTNMAPVMAGGGGSPIYNITVHASGNIATSEAHLGDIVSKAFLDKMKGQNKIG